MKGSSLYFETFMHRVDLFWMRAVAAGLAALAILVNCGAPPAQVALPDTPTAPAVKLALPTPAPTATPSATPTRPPTFTPTATASPTATPEPAATPEPTACACDIERVVIISIDGLRPDALELAETPFLDALRAAGAYSDKAQTVLPSVTLVNHASMLSGVGPEKHKIIWNEINLSLGIIEVPTVFSLAHEAGLSTAMVVGKPKFEHLVVPGSVDDYYYAGFTDSQIVKQTLQVIEAGLPDLLFIHLPDVDSAGHLTGWMSPGQLATIALTDSQVGKIVSALEAGDALETSLLIITADHGGHERIHGSDLPEDMTIPWLAVGPGIPAGMTIESDIVIYDTAATALHALGVAIPPSWDGRPVLDIFNQLPESSTSLQERE
jgi:hypothetical protein